MPPSSSSVSAALPQAPRENKEKNIVRLTQRDFAQGTYIATQPDTVLILSEDITVSFPPIEKHNQKSPLHLGWFAAIAFAAPRQTLKLNGKTLRMHPNFRERQRFFSLVSCDITPFPPGKMRFDTTPRSPTDLCILGPGTLGLTSHFCVHSNTLKEGRVRIANVKMEHFEVGAISLSGCNDVHIHNCTFGRARAPTRSSHELMLHDLMLDARHFGATQQAKALAKMITRESTTTLTSSDAICRACVITNEFNVNQIKDSFPNRIERVAITDCTFDDLMAEPKEVVGVSERDGGTAIKDRNGNLLAWEDVKSGAMISRLQASFNKELSTHVRDKLVSGPSSDFYPVFGLDLRGHSLKGKASAFVRVDGCTNVTLANLRGTNVLSHGPQAAAVGFMANGCERLLIKHVKINSVRVLAPCTDPLNDDRPKSGLIIRHCRHVMVDDYIYNSSDACGAALKSSSDVTLKEYEAHAPTTFLHCKHLRLM